jgi:hypothetical protein
MTTKMHGYVRQLFSNAGASQTSAEFAWPGGLLELVGEATLWGGQGVSLEIELPNGVFVPATDLFIKKNGTINGFVCPCTIRGVTGLGASGVNAWVIGIPV